MRYLLLLLTLATVGCVSSQSPAPTTSQPTPPQAPAPQAPAPQTTSAPAAPPAGLRSCTAATIERRYDEAIRDCTRLLDNERLPTAERAIALHARGEAWHGKGDTARALADLDQAITLAPLYGLAYHARGNTYRSIQRYDDALQDLNDAVRLLPEPAMAHNDRGNVLLDLGSFERASRDYEIAMRLRPTEVAPFRGRGFARYMLTQWDKAIADFDQASRLAPSDDFTVVYRGLARFGAGDWQGAARDLQAATTLAPVGQERWLLAQTFLYLAKARLGQDARGELERADAAMPKRVTQSYYVALFLGRLTPARLLDTQIGSNNAEQQLADCRGYSYIGLQHLIDGRKPEATTAFRNATARQRPNCSEAPIAQAELKRLGILF